MMARHRVRKAAQRQAHALRLDNRRPGGSVQLDDLRREAQQARREARRG